VGTPKKKSAFQQNSKYRYLSDRYVGVNQMEASLESFLQATDLDDLLVAHHQLTRINREDAAVLHEIIISGTDRQAIANMLMYPEVIPAPNRNEALLRALHSDPSDYQLLAAVVGVQRLGDTTGVPPEINHEVTECLLGALASVRPTGMRASVALMPLLDDIGIESLLEILPRVDEAVRHNVLVMAVNRFGDGAVSRAVKWLNESSRLDNETAHSCLSEISRLEEGINRRVALAYIPNLVDWAN
jgi:hypothetical protein